MENVRVRKCRTRSRHDRRTGDDRRQERTNNNIE